MGNEGSIWPKQRGGFLRTDLYLSRDQRLRLCWKHCGRRLSYSGHPYRQACFQQPLLVNLVIVNPLSFCALATHDRVLGPCNHGTYINSNLNYETSRPILELAVLRRHHHVHLRAEVSLVCFWLGFLSLVHLQPTVRVSVLMRQSS